MSRDPEPGEDSAAPELDAHDTEHDLAERPGPSSIGVLLVGAFILTAAGVAAVVVTQSPVLMVLLLGCFLGGTVGTVRAHGRDKQANLSTRARAAASGAAVGLLAAVGLSALSGLLYACLLYTSPSPRDRTRSRMPSSA